MGLLDDAIRQHLDLKRQHGADPADVAQKEREAFGPIKRGDLEVGTTPEELEGDERLHEGREGVAPGGNWAGEPPIGDPEPSGSVAFEPDPVPPLAPPEDAVPEPPAAPHDAAVPEPPAAVLGDAASAPAADAPFPLAAPLDEPFAPSAEPSAYAPAPAEPTYDPAPVPPLEEPAEPFQDIGEPTQEYSFLDDAPDPQPDAAPGEHDELEETPEFLEETPEHDRLWFEQKPPRDFDF